MTKIVGIAINDSKIYFSYFDGNSTKSEIIKPMDLALSFFDGKITFSNEALKAKSCISFLNDLESLKTKIVEKDCQKFVTNDFDLWVLMMKKIKEHIISSLSFQGELKYVISIPEGGHPSLRDYILISCKANGMNLLRIMTADYCSMLGYVTNTYCCKNNNTDKLIMSINLDDDHTCFTTFFVSLPHIIKIHSLSYAVGQRDFLRLTAQEIYKNDFPLDFDGWEQKQRKKAEEIYNVINSFSEENNCRTYFRNEDDEAIEVTRDGLGQLFDPFNQIIAQLAQMSLNNSLEIIKQTKFEPVLNPSNEQLSQPSFENSLKSLNFEEIYFCGEHKNSFVIREIERLLGISSNPGINQQKIIADGCGWYAHKMELKGMSDRASLSCDKVENNYTIDSILSPESINIFSTTSTFSVKAPTQYQLASNLIEVPQLPINEELYVSFSELIYNREAQTPFNTPCIGKFIISEAHNKFKLSIQKFLGNVQGFYSSYCADEKSVCLIENGCEEEKRNQETLGPNGNENSPTKYSDCKIDDTDCDSLFFVEGCEMFKSLETVCDIVNINENTNVEMFWGVFEKERIQAEKVAQTQCVQDEIKKTLYKELIAKVDEGKKKEITVAMNKMLRSTKDDPDLLRRQWEELAKKYVAQN